MAFRNSRKGEKKIRLKGKKVPFVLIVAKFLLFLVVLRYVFSYVLLLASPIEPTPRLILVNGFSAVFSVGMAILAIDSMMGISSGRPKSWRKVMRSSISLFLVNAIFDVLNYYHITSSSQLFNTYFVGLIILVIFLIMCLPSVRSFYSPPMYPMPPLKDWMKFITFVPLIGAESYSFSYEDPSSGNVHDLDEGLKAEDTGRAIS